MKIASIEASLHQFPIHVPLIDKPIQNPRRVFCKVATDDGIVDRLVALERALLSEVTTVYADTVPFLESLRARGVPFIFATGYGDNQSAPQGFDAPTIRKPYDVTQVAAALAEATGRV